MSGSGAFIQGTSTLLGPMSNPGAGILDRLCYEMLFANSNELNCTFVMTEFARAIQDIPQGGVVLADR